MKERPILFNSAMVRAILAGQKTQTRRPIKDVPSWEHFGRDIMDWDLSGIHQLGYGDDDQLEGTDKWYLDVQTDVDDHSRRVIHCPFGKPGDRLWVRETHFINDYRGARVPEDERADVELVYAATDEDYVRNLEDDEGFAWRPSIHMPRWACRLVLEITDVRVERLQAISEEDCAAEGVTRDTEPCDHTRRSCADVGCLGPTYRSSFADLWTSTGGDWDSNPWVWLIGFRRIAG
ncbi:hypothetical protein ACP93_02460 [Xanthomonas sp. NCPPB 1128]|uniref:hypothetical protein n=1 Tax=Xanthomonas sp. NCPPB 1128 TaxID=1775876 RepID=UPI00065AFDDD|nr:hypothetical protein [Xanthomonas sp. NCPPB 1128]KMM77047.1 hypothetical protein ACP93_02195 [Xanthomonas sp. NCPPB 1128]KMM77091.1 hypothetical protein ACP93_02460 [Xanthomonas sp. NCPPB 1128]